mmetsp:Transcript_24718/g.34371  ORF Transcript_24718/g.34371 Transcript_24718/m.34371 type:complete len:107 (-) Transcript_24718:366-686(-)
MLKFIKAIEDVWQPSQKASPPCMAFAASVIIPSKKAKRTHCFSVTGSDINVRDDTSDENDPYDLSRTTISPPSSRSSMPTSGTKVGAELWVGEEEEEWHPSCSAVK